MFVGHFAVALVAKRAAPRLPLALLFAAVQLLDIVWPLFIVLGIEHARITPGITAASPLDLYDIPYSHSLVAALGWSLLAGAPLAALRRLREAVIVAGCVFSHFILDLVTHQPDLQLVPGVELRVGLGLWNHLAAAIIVESILFAVCLLVYLRGTRATRRAGDVGLAALTVVLMAVWLSGSFAPPPPGIGVVAWSALIAIPIILGWAHVIDRARPVIVGVGAAPPPRTAPATATSP